MSKLGRNELCPCGSGKKYKHCCLARTAAYQNLLQDQANAKMRAVTWLMQQYGEAVDEALSIGFLQDEDGEMEACIAELPGSTQNAVLVCMHEWLIADAHLILDEQTLKASDLLLGPGGPLFTTNGRRHIEELAASELSLYEVLEVHKGKGLLLRDMVRTNEAPVFVHEVKATEVLVPWDTLGVRILRADGTCTLGGGAYPLRRSHAIELAEFLKKEIKREGRKKRPKATAGEIITVCLINTWLDALIMPPPIPMLVDSQTNEPILFTKDRYSVSNWQEMEDILDSLDDMEREDETVWTWKEPINEERYRSLARLERLPSGILEVECSTKSKGDASRKFLEKLAIPLLSHTGRETEDPREKLLEKSRSGTGATPPKSKNEIPLEVQQEVLFKFLANHYETWPTTPLPALNGKTPLQAARLKTYRPKLVELLKSIEQGEAKRARDSGTPAFDINFLWKRLGLTRE